MAPNMGAGDPHSKATSDPDEEEGTEEERQHNEGQHTEEKEEILRLVKDR